jgi:hypothetical protein
LQWYKTQEFALLDSGGAGLCGKRAAVLAHCREMLGLDHAAADQQ